MGWTKGSTLFQGAIEEEEFSQVHEGGVMSLREARRVCKYRRNETVSGEGFQTLT